MGTKTITPRTHNDGQIGSSSKYWNKGYFNELNANTLNLTTLELSGTLAVSEGGTGSGTHTSKSILIGDGTNSIKSYTDLRYYTDDLKLTIGGLSTNPAVIERPAGFTSPLGDLDIKAPIPQIGSLNFRGGNLNLHAGASSGNQNGGDIQFWASQPNVGSGTTIRNTSVVATIGYGGLYLAENSGKIIFEGGTPNNFETTLLVTDPTADRTITFPDATGTVALTSGIPTNTNLANTDLTLTGSRTHNMNGSDFIFRDGTQTSDNILHLDPGANEISFGGAGVNGNIEVYHFYSGDLAPDFRIYEKASHGSNYGKFTYAGALGGDRTYTLPDATGTVALTSDITNTTLNGTTANGVATYASANTLDINAKFTWDNDDLLLESNSNQKPEFRILSKASTNKPANITFAKDYGSAAVAHDYIGTISFKAQNSTPAEKVFGMVQGAVGTSVTAGQEVGKMSLRVSTSNGSAQSIRDGLYMIGHATNGSVSTQIGYGSLSNTLVGGSLEITSGLTFDSVALNGIQTSSESFADNDTSLMTSAAIDDRILSHNPKKQIIGIRSPYSYHFYLWNASAWATSTMGTISVFGTGSTPITTLPGTSTPSSNYRYSARMACFTATSDVLLDKLTFSYYWYSSTYAPTTADQEFAFQKHTLVDGTAASVAMTNVDATNIASVTTTENVPYTRTFVFNGTEANRTLQAGQALTFYMRQTSGSGNIRVQVWGGPAQLELTLI